jgi:hypothetical protein
MKTERKGRYLNTLERYYIYMKSVRIIYTWMTQTLIHIIPYSSHYTGIARTYTPYIPHSNHHQNSINTKQAPYKRLNVHHTTHGTPTRK